MIESRRRTPDLTARVESLNIDKPGDGVLRFESDLSGRIRITDAQEGVYLVDADSLVKAVKYAYIWNKDKS